MSFHLDRGETLAILGESGSGKSVSASAVMNLIDSPPGYITAGEIRYKGESLIGMDRERRRQINGRKIAMIFQDPLAHLNPVYTVGWQIAEMLTAHGVAGADAKARTLELMERVGIPDAKERMNHYPHQFSGGQRQRLMIAHGARAEAGHPDRRRADDRAGRDRPGADPAPARGAAAGDRHGPPADHPRSRRRRRSRRPGRGDECGRDRRERQRARRLQAPDASLYAES